MDNFFSISQIFNFWSKVCEKREKCFYVSLYTTLPYTKQSFSKKKKTRLDRSWPITCGHREWMLMYKRIAFPWPGGGCCSIKSHFIIYLEWFVNDLYSTLADRLFVFCCVVGNLCSTPFSPWIHWKPVSEPSWWGTHFGSGVLILWPIPPSTHTRILHAVTTTLSRSYSAISVTERVTRGNFRTCSRDGIHLY